MNRFLRACALSSLLPLAGCMMDHSVMHDPGPHHPHAPSHVEGHDPVFLPEEGAPAAHAPTDPGAPAPGDAHAQMQQELAAAEATPAPSPDEAPAQSLVEAPAPGPQEPPPTPVEGPAPVPPAPTPEPAPAPAPIVSGSIEAADAETEALLRRLLQDRTVADQEARSVSEKHYRLGVEMADRGHFENAKRELQQAVSAWPENRAAHQKLREVNDTLIGGRQTDGLQEIETAVNVERARIQQNHMEINNHIRSGERLFAARQYEAAQREFRDAIFKIEAIPYPNYPLKQYLDGLKGYVQRTEAALRDRETAEKKLQQQQARAIAEGREDAERREMLEFIAHRLQQAFMYFDQKQFEKCAKVCDQILLVDPHYVVAVQLKQDALRLRHRIKDYDFIKLKVDGWLKMREQDAEAVVPYSQTIKFPPREVWGAIAKRALEESVSVQEAAAAEPDLLASVIRELEGIRIEEFVLAKATVFEALNRLRKDTGMNLVLDQRAVKKQGLEGRRLDLRFNRATAQAVLGTVLKQCDLHYRVMPGRILFITDREGAQAQTVAKLHDVADIIARTTDWAASDAQQMVLRPPDTDRRSAIDGRTNAFYDITRPEPEAPDRYQEMVDLIKRNVAAGTWDTGTTSIRITPSRQLLAMHTQQVQDELKEFLAGLRGTTGTMISVTCRFLAAYDDFLEEVGLDIYNQPPFQPYSIVGNIPTLTSIPPSGTDMNDFSGIRGPGAVFQERAGTEYYDLRAQTFNTYRGGGVGAFADKKMGGRLLNTGGLAVQLQLLGAEAVQMVMNAVHKENKATLMQAPRLTVFNTQRAHIMAVRQQAYIQDLTATVGGATATLDPDIGILMTGIVLDVTPIVSHDRKYVTMELRPSLAELQTIRNLTLLTAVSNQGIFPVNIQLPYVVLQRAEATVIAPDRGTVMLSGFKDIVYTDIETQTPILGDIPILGFLFKRQSKSHERRRLTIMVTPEIIDLQEIEDEQF